MILHTDTLVKTLRSRCDNAKKRIWIASPFIGNINDVKKILGGMWMRNSVDFRILTDVDEGFIRRDTYEEFIKYNTEIRSLLSIHAKIYIVDDWCLVTSANLTGTAFSKRYEIGSIITVEDFPDIVNLFNNWWDMSKPVKSYIYKPNSALLKYQDGNLFSTKCKLPSYKTEISDKYLAKCDLYKDFTQLYVTVTGRNKNMVKDGFTPFQEVDYFFNYLYHDHPLTPSNKLTESMKLSKAQQVKQVLYYFEEMQYKKGDGINRLKKSDFIQTVLSLENIDNIDWTVIENVVKCFHCYKSYPLNKARFLNPDNNSLLEIKEKWKYLLYSEEITSKIIDEVTSNLRYFGTSSVQELIGWFFPLNYPLMNSNSDCGMRFFGYNI